MNELYSVAIEMIWFGVASVLIGGFIGGYALGAYIQVRKTNLKLETMMNRIKRLEKNWSSSY